MPRSTDISPLSVLLSRVDAVADGTHSADTIPSGFPSLDKMLGGGMRRGDLVVLGGDVGAGKSALALAISIRAAGISPGATTGATPGHDKWRVRERDVAPHTTHATHAQKTALLTGEMSVDRVLERVIAIEARTRIDDLRQGGLDDAARANAGAVALRLRDQLPIVERLPAGRGVTPVAELLDGLPDVGLVVVDGVGALAAGATATDEELAAAIRGLKTLALDREVTILTTAPLPLLAARADRRPELDDFGALGAVKQFADVVLALFRQDMYEPSRDIVGATELLVRKNRNGPTGYVDLYFYAQWMRFEDMLDPDR